MRITMIDYIILEVQAGSYLYGTNTPTSDEDFIAVGIQDIRYILGLGTIEQTTFKPGNVDKTIYTVKQFCKLAVDNNPNLLELLFVPQNKIKNASLEGIELLQLKDKFPSKLLIQKFKGYAFSQRHKMEIKLENYDVLQNTLHWLDNQLEEHKYMLELLQLSPHHAFTVARDYIRVGDINIPTNATIKMAKKYINHRLDMFGNRKNLVSKYGYDTKFAMHLLRLLLECKELLLTCKLNFPLSSKDFLLEVRNGKYDMQQIKDISYKLEQEIDTLAEITKLPAKPDFQRVENFVIHTYSNFIRSKKEWQN
jgi:predicted nucleotidyltransferase